MLQNLYLRRVAILIPKTVGESCNAYDLEFKYIFVSLYRISDVEGWYLFSYLFIMLSVYNILSPLVHAKTLSLLDPSPIIMPFIHIHFILFNIYLLVCMCFYKMNVLFVCRFNVYKLCWYKILWVGIFLNFFNRPYLLKIYSLCCEHGLDI